MVKSSDWIVEQVRPVVLPLLPTLSPNPGVPIVWEGAAAAMLVVPTGPRSKIVPERSTCPALISAIAASTLLGEWPQSGAVAFLHGPVVSLAAGLSARPWVRWANVSGGCVGPAQAACKG